MERLVSSLLLTNQQEHQRARVSILGALIVVFALVLTLLVHLYSRNAATEELQHDFDTYANTTADRISVAVNNQVQAIERMAARWEVAQGTSRHSWESDARSYLHDLTGMESIEWLDANRNLRWSVRRGGAHEPRGAAHLNRGTLRQAIDRTYHTRISVMPVSLPLGGQGILIVHRLQAGLQSGFLVATVSLRGLLRPWTQRLAMDGYVMSLSRNHVLAYRGVAPSSGNIRQATLPLSIKDGTWQLHLQMTNDSERQRRALLPNMVLSAGIGTAALVAIIFYFWTLGIRKTFELQQSKQFMQSVMNNVPQYIFWKDRDSVYQGGNLNFVHAAGFKDEREIIGKTDFDFPWAEDEAVKYREDDQRIMERGIPELRIQETQRTASGEMLYVETNKVPLRDEHDDVIGILGTYEDVTQRRLAEAAMRQSRDQLEATLKATPDLLFELDESGRFMAVHETSSKLMTMVPEQIVGKTIYDVLPTEAARAMFDALEEADRSGSSSGRLLHLDLPGQGKVWFELFVAGKAAMPNEAKRFIVISRNITERKRSEDALRIAKEAADAANQAKSEFLSTMSHEIRTPMNGVIGMTSLLFDTPLNEEQKECAQTIRLSAENLLRIIDEVLDFSKIEAGQMAIEHIEFSLRQIVENCVDLVLTKAQQKSLAMASFIAPDVPDTLLGDPVRLRQILLNFLNNAVKFTERGKVLVRVGLQSADAATRRIRLHFEVQDTGIGITAASQKKLFQPFSQADNSMTRRYGGTGLGLSICKRLSELMGGDIGMESRIGVGSRFWVDLPFMLASKDDAESVRPQAMDGLHVLIAGECGEHREALEAYLRYWGMSANFVDDSMAASAWLKDATGHTDMLLLMQPLPDMDLQQAIQTLKHQPEAQGIPILVCLEAHDARLRSELLSSGASNVLAAPIKQSELFNAISGTLTAPHPPAERTSIPKSSDDTGQHLQPAHTNRRVLLVEDNLVNQRVALKLLHKFGLEVQIAANGLEAVEMARQRTYDLILMDCQMPVMDGFDATLQIRRYEFSKPTRTPIIAITANAMQGDREQCLAAGMDDYIAKPVEVARIQEVLDTWLPQNRNVPVIDSPSAAVPTADPTEPINLARLREFLADDEAGINELLQVFGNTLSDIRGRMAQALSIKDASFSSLMHELQGSAANIGAARLAGLALELKQAFNSANWQALAEIHHAIEKEIYSVESFIASRVQNT